MFIIVMMTATHTQQIEASEPPGEGAVDSNIVGDSVVSTVDGFDDGDGPFC